MLTPSPFKTMIHPDARKRLHFLDEIEGSSVGAFLEAISRPGPGFHMRANTIKAVPAQLVAKLQASHPQWSFVHDARIPEAILVDVTGPRSIGDVAKKVLVDRFSAESIAMSAPLFAPGFKQSLHRFAAGEQVGVVTRFTTSWDGQQHEIHCANGIASFPSNVMHEQSHGVVVSTTESWYSSPPVQSWPEYQDGSILDQNFPSMVASRALGPAKGDVVLEMCCGAGGKSTHVAQLMQDEGTIYAVDRAAIKIGRLRERASRMGISIIKPVVSRSERLRDVLEPARASKVLIDPPCSALGLRLKFSIDASEKDFGNFQANQSRIFDNVMKSGFVDQGTRIVYCTCTVTREENELLVAEKVAEHGLKIVDPAIRIGHPGLPVDTLSREETARMIRFFPHVDNVAGFFIACMEKE